VEWDEHIVNEPTSETTVSGLPAALTDGFDGAGVVFTGQFTHHTRDELTETVTEHGGRVTTAVSGNIDALFIGDNPGQRKHDAADENNVPLLDPVDFWRTASSGSLPESGPTTLNGTTVVFTGAFSHHARSELTAIVEAHGGRVTSHVSGNTDVLVVGDDPGTRKREDAQQNDVPMLSPEEFWLLVEHSKDER